jgi:Zn-dependent protease with chaperone function
MTAPTKLGFIRAFLLPASMLFALPAFAVWFAGHAEHSYDRSFFALVFPQIDRDATLSQAERANLHRFYENVPPSRACMDRSPELASYRENLGETCSDLGQFAWSRRAAWSAIAVGLGALLFALLCALAAFLSRPAQYVSFLLGWNVLKLVGAVETLLQGGLLVWLSFWTTALWTERYFVKLIGIAGVIAVAAAFKVIVAIFRRPAGGVDVEGELLSEQGSPELWARIRELCKALGSTPPDQIVAGIDDNFFVSEGEVRVAGRALSGRTLYVSLSLLRTLQRSEAEAVLAHEMAHLLGGDTGHSKKLAPLVTRFIHYLEALHAGLITRPIFYFMRAYFAVFQLSVGQSHRRAEFAADALAARVTSPLDIARSLIKVGAYSSYRGRVEEALFGADRVHAEVGIALRVSSGFGDYARTEKLHFDLHDSVTPHPFDSHPPLRERLANVGCQLAAEDYASVLTVPVQSSWFEAIAEAPAIEARLWDAYEQRFAQAHDLALAYRYQPATDEERAHVEKHFPALTFEGKEPAQQAQLDFANIRYFEWEAPVGFDEIASASVEERMFKKYLDLKLKEGGVFKSKRSICLTKLADADGLLAAFNRYYGRHQVMLQNRSSQ